MRVRLSGTVVIGIAEMISSSRSQGPPGAAGLRCYSVRLTRRPCRRLEAVTSYQLMAMNLETERLTMRSWAETDAEDYRALVAERDDGVLTVEAARERIANLLAASAETGIALLPICRRVEGDFIGYCGLIIGRATVEEPEIAYELFRRVHGHGYATEAARAVLDAAIATGRKRLWSTVGVWNTPSLRVLEKLGFERDHVAPDNGKGEVVWLTRTLP
jgi:RimJ/RimL family protein N-acetyltransferase